MPFSLEKNCQPDSFEEDIYLQWEKAGLFNPDNFPAQKEKYCNILPPPNANGELHLGHASGYTFMDILGRFQRMSGKKTLLLPGKDHAGIQTQVVYERKLKNEFGLSRQDLGREKFYGEIYDFCQDRMVYMRKQEKKIGISADWSREKFTLDPQIVKTVLETFIKMYYEKDSHGQRLVYQGERVINWCPRCATALSDFEVEHEEQDNFLYTFKYDPTFPFDISTTRPETKLGDTAVAVNPKDKRYSKFIGKIIKADFCGKKLNLKIIADQNVDQKFGTGALGVTPAHSQIDWEIAQKNNLLIIPVINEEGRIRANFGKFSGKTALEAREEIIVQLKEKGLLSKTKKIKNNLSVCERCKTAIEPLPSQQWFINMDHSNFSFKKAARKAIEKNEIEIYPQRFKKIMLSWIDNVHDWCISRQIWWGPQIPAWYKNNQIKVQLDSPGPGWIQDNDTFDTWFSSGQWAYTTLGYPTGQDFKDFYPSDTMIMGRDILPLWAFRMIILSLYRTGKIPFKKLYFTGLVRDEKGQKMSKSKGNGIEPLEMIKKYGADATRLSFVIGSTAGNDINLGETKISGYRNLINKLWNISRFILSRRENKEIVFPNSLPQKNLTLADRWILKEMNQLIKTVTADLEKFHFSSAGEKLRDFTWNKLADWYLEIAKFESNIRGKNQLLLFLLRDLLKLWHPFIPFVTEKIWQEFNLSQQLMVSPWPQRKIYPTRLKTQNFQLIQEIIVALRNFRSQANLLPKQKIEIALFSEKHHSLLKEQRLLIDNLRTNVLIKEISPQNNSAKKGLSLFIKETEIFIPLKNLLNLQEEITRIKKELAETESFVRNLEKRLKNQNFLQKAPKEIIEKEKNRQKSYQEKIEKNKNYLKNLEKAL